MIFVVFLLLVDVPYESVRMPSDPYSWQIVGDIVAAGSMGAGAVVTRADWPKEVTLTGVPARARK